MDPVLYEKMAVLAVRRGVNVQKGQILVIRSSVENYEFVRMLVKEAYEAGAGRVEIDWRDEENTKEGYLYQSEETLADIPDWMHDREKWRHDHHACYLSIESEAPGGMKDIDPKKIHAYQNAYTEKMDDLDHYLMANEGQWSIIGLPSVEWAEKVFPELDSNEAYEKLGNAIFAASRVSVDTDPLENWEKHDSVLIEHAKKMTDFNFDSVHFTNSLGTDLTVGLVKNHIWVGGGDTTPEGVYFDPNIPTEEVFCMPDKDNVNGIVYASRPLSYNGKVIENFWFRFENGRVVDFGAEKEQEALQQLLDFDEGSRHLGEVALVPYDSPISKSGILFFNTLYDENAACHLALGASYPENLQGGVNMSREELKEHGANSSRQHEDFMFGTADLNADGLTSDGKTIPVFRNGSFVI